MDKIILGILMLRRMTAYEIRNTIRRNFKSICSDSLGSIQAALKKLLTLERVTYEELVEKGVNKKRYAISDVGQQALIEWLKVPIDISKTKNMDFGKLLFMGYIPQKKRLELIDTIILSLNEEYTTLKALQNSIDAEEEQTVLESHLLADNEYRNRIKKLGNTDNLSQNIREISKFTLAALQYGIDMAAFNITWFEKLKKDIKN